MKKDEEKPSGESKQNEENAKKTNGEEHEDLTVVQGAGAESEGPDAAVERLQKDLLYLRADFDNYRRRILREQETSIKFANEKFIGELLSVVDLFDRAMMTSKPLKAKSEGTTLQAELANFILGIDMTQRELANVFGRFGVEFTGSVGEKFDPSRHEAITEQETSEDKANTVLDVLQKGATMHGRLLKPARVVVGKPKS